MPDLLNEILFIFQRLNWLSALDLALVTIILFGILVLLRDTQANVLLRGVIFLILLLALLTSFVNLPAFSWLIQTTLPALLLAIPVIFAPEIRRGWKDWVEPDDFHVPPQRNCAREAVQQHADCQHSLCPSIRPASRCVNCAERSTSLKEYVSTGVYLDAAVTPEILLQIFYPNTPLHDGAVIVAENRIVAAACVMPLSASGILNRTPERGMD